MLTEAGNRALRNPAILQNLGAGLRAMNAGASYACDRDGARSATIIASFDSPAKTPVIAKSKSSLRK